MAKTEKNKVVVQSFKGSWMLWVYRLSEDDSDATFIEAILNHQRNRAARMQKLAAAETEHGQRIDVGYGTAT